MIAKVYNMISADIDFGSAFSETGFSLMAGLDLELDSDMEMDETPTQPIPTATPAITTYQPIPEASTSTFAVAKKDIFNPPAGTPFFFLSTYEALEPNLTPLERMQKWTGGMRDEEGNVIEVKPFVRCETE